MTLLNAEHLRQWSGIKQKAALKAWLARTAYPLEHKSNAEPYKTNRILRAAVDDTRALAARLCTTTEVLRAIVDWAGPMQDAPRSSRPEWFDDARAVLAQLEKEGLT